MNEVWGHQQTTNDGQTAKLNELSESRPGDVKHRWCSVNHKENKHNYNLVLQTILHEKGGSVGNGLCPAMKILQDISGRTRSVKI